MQGAGRVAPCTPSGRRPLWRGPLAVLASLGLLFPLATAPAWASSPPAASGSEPGSAGALAHQMLRVGPLASQQAGVSPHLRQLSTAGATPCSPVPSSPAPGTATSASGPNPALPVYPGPPSPATTTAAVTTASNGSAPLNTYYLVLSNGSVRNFGGAAFFGSAVHKRLLAPVVAAASTPDGGGYWMASARGSIYNYGDAGFFGSAVHKKLGKPVVAMEATPDGKGYWLAAASGAVYNYGDAPFCGSAVHARLGAPVVAMASTPDGGGYWLVTSAGAVSSYGDALAPAKAPVRRLPSPVVAMASTPDGGGYWLVTAKGNIYPFGDAGFFGSPIHDHFKRPVVSITATADGNGYWVASATGQIFNFGDAPFSGSLVHAMPRGRTKVATLILRPVPPAPVLDATPVLDPAPWPHAIFGYDISNFQCSTSTPTAMSSSLPSVSAATIIEVAGWLDNSDNPCLAAEAAWATQAAGSTGAHYGLYLFVNSPSGSATSLAQGATGPGGTCASLAADLQAPCIAYNYGYNGAYQAFSYAASVGVSSPVWWIDVENDALSSTDYSNFPRSYWSSSTTLNDETIEGALDALRAAGATVGLYGTSVQYLGIAGPFVPASPQVPLWVAGAPWTNPPYTEAGLPDSSVLAPWCAGSATYASSSPLATAAFAGGVPWVLQETPGGEPSPYGLDPDYLC